MTFAKLSEELKWRGFFNQTTFDSITDVDEETKTFYWGVDPSADSMTIGNLAAAMMVRVFMDHGWKAILLVGGATGMIGDPDGKKDERNLKTFDEITRNKKAIADEYAKIFSGMEFTVVDNYDWFKDINYLDFLREVGKHVSITQMLDRSFIQDRIGEGGTGISYAEFSYSLIQGYDFLELYRKHKATVQLCGADQWGNSISGVDLIRRIEGGKAHVYSCPLIVNKTTGVKFGKSEEGAIWLNPEKTSVYDFYQFWLNVDDLGVASYLKTYTTIDSEEHEELLEKHAVDPSARVAQKELAFRITALIHGQDNAVAVRELTDILFGGKSPIEAGAETIGMIIRELPTVTYEDGLNLSQALLAAGVVSSNSEARRLITSNAVSLNGSKTTDPALQVNPLDLYKVGKNRFMFIKR